LLEITNSEVDIILWIYLTTLSGLSERTINAVAWRAWRRSQKQVRL